MKNTAVMLMKVTHKPEKLMSLMRGSIMMLDRNSKMHRIEAAETQETT